MDITINYTEIYSVVERSLSVIGKRSTDENGNRLFTDITLGTREKEIANDYFRSAIVALAADLRQYVTVETFSATSFTVRISLYEDHNEHLEPTITQAINNYIVAYALFSWFVITAPRLQEKYMMESERYRSYIIYQVFYHQRPSSLPNPLRQKSET